MSHRSTQRDEQRSELTKEGNPARDDQSWNGNAALSNPNNVGCTRGIRPSPSERGFGRRSRFFTETWLVPGPKKISGNRSTAPSMLERSIFESCFTSSKSTWASFGFSLNHSQMVISYGLSRIPLCGGSKKASTAVSSTPRRRLRKTCRNLREKTTGWPDRTVSRDLPSRRSCDHNDETDKSPESEEGSSRTTRLSGNAAYLRKALFKQDRIFSFLEYCPIADASHPNVAGARIAKFVRDRDRIRSLIHGERWLRATVQVPSK